MSSTVGKALGLMRLFSEDRREAGLSDVARLAGMDKATAYRHLTALEQHGFVEQNPATKLYRLGPAVLSLARIREATFPVASVIQPALDALAEETGETAHAALLAGNALVSIGTVESRKGNRVSLKAGETLPFHATASGVVFLAFARETVVKRALQGKLAAFTPQTIVSLEQLRRMIDAARRNGTATADQSYEADVYGIAAPLFGPDGYASGAIAVATPCHRMTRDLRSSISAALIESSISASRKLGAEPPPHFIKLMARKAA